MVASTPALEELSRAELVPVAFDHMLSGMVVTRALLVLALVEEARRRRLPFVYLGYWIADSAKMSYKARFRPLEALGPKGWQTILA